MVFLNGVFLIRRNNGACCHSKAIVNLAIIEGRTFAGEAAALTAAFLWAAATLMFGKMGRQLSPLVLNIVKGVFAIAFLTITLAVQQIISASSFTLSLPPNAAILLLLSGAIGIGIGDTAYFWAINTLGARKALLLETLAPPVTAILAWIFLSEQLSITSVIGILLTLIGIASVVNERVPGTDQTKQGAGLKFALLAVFCQASGAVLSRSALASTVVVPLWSSLIRLLAGLAFIGALAALQPHQLGDYQPIVQPDKQVDGFDRSSWRSRWQQSLKELKTPSLLVSIALAAFFATYLGIWLQQISLKYTEAGIAQALLATSPLFVLPMAALLGDRISWRATLGAVVALSGVWVLLFFR